MKVSKITQLTGHRASVFCMEPGPQEGQLLSAGGDGWIVRWDLDHPESGQLVAKVETRVFSLCHLADLGMLVAGNMDGGVHWIDLVNGQDVRNIAHHRRGVFAIRRAGGHVFSAGGDGLLTRWSIEGARTLESYQLSNQALRSLDYSPERNEIAVGASDHSIYLLDADTLALRHHVPLAHENSVFTVRYAPGSRHLLSGGRDAHLRVWDLEGPPTLFHDVPAHWFTVNSIDFHPGGRWFATASRDRTVKIWDAATFELKKVLDTARDRGHAASVNCVCWPAYRDYLISAGDDRTGIVWRVEE